MKNKLLGIALLLGFASFGTFVTMTVASVQFQSDFALQESEKSNEFYTAYVENAFHVEAIPLTTPVDQAKKEQEEKRQGMTRTAMVGRDKENKERHNKQLAKVAPQAKYKPMPKDSSIDQKNTFEAIVSAQQEVRIALWEKDKKYLAELNEPNWWERLTTAHANSQSKTPAGNGYQSRCEQSGDQETNASEKYAPCPFSEAIMNEVAAYNAYLTAQLNLGEALQRDFCTDYAEKCSQSASTGGLIPTAYAKLEMGGASLTSILNYQETERRPKYEKEMQESFEAAIETMRQYQEFDRSQNEHLRTETTIKGEEAENARLKTMGGTTSDEKPRATGVFYKKFHDSSSGQGGTQQHMQA